MVPSFSIVYGPEAYALGLKFAVAAKKSVFLAGGYAILGIVPVSGAFGLTSGLEFLPVTVEANLTLVAWTSERLNSDSSILLANFNPKIKLHSPTVTNDNTTIGPFVSVGPSFFNPEEWYDDGVNYKLLGELWNFEAGLKFY
jgi:hypothetical protein